jgi:putative solute:sodium symporter small subunit
MSGDLKPADTVHDAYWRRVRRLTCALLLSWFVMTFGFIFFARELADIRILGWPVSFYMAAQGLTLTYLLIVAVYVIRMQMLDRHSKDESADVE